MTDAHLSRDAIGVIITEELKRRPSRAADHETECRLLSIVLRELAERPEGALQRLTDALVELGIAGSAGVSLAEGDDLRWAAMSGARLPSGIPIDAGPGGGIGSRSELLLIEPPADFLPGEAADAPVQEILLAPFHLQGRIAGTLWLVAHDPGRKFDGEDARLLASLPPVAAAAYRAMPASGGADEAARREAEERDSLLLGELQHRVRNTLGVVRSIARRTALNSRNVEEMAAHLDGRIDAFARVQAMVTRKPGAGVDLAMLIEDELVAHAAREGMQFSLSGPEVALRAKPAETLSLAFHELVTNAVKYGALAGEKGRIDVRWSAADGRLDFHWEESGAAAPVREPDHEGFGLELLRRMLPYDLKAEIEVEFRPKGLSFGLSMPLEQG
ncbi:MAG: hypothetical protein JO276_02410 [Sphingomonadaceae bacterium]|nr:hypothetical protein [Sphingomonadaceae bacterium]